MRTSQASLARWFWFTAQVLDQAGLHSRQHGTGRDFLVPKLEQWDNQYSLDAAVAHPKRTSWADSTSKRPPDGAPELSVTSLYGMVSARFCSTYFWKPMGLVAQPRDVLGVADTKRLPS
jgi:hypothetical protein